MLFLRHFLATLSALFLLVGCGPSTKSEWYILSPNQTASSFVLDKEQQDFVFSNALKPVKFTVYTMEGENFVSNNLPTMDVTLRPHEKVYWYADIKKEDGSIYRATFNVEMRRAMGKWDGIQRHYSSGKHKRLLETVHYFEATPEQKSTLLNLAEFRVSPQATIYIKGRVQEMTLTLEAPPGEKLVFEKDGKVSYDTKWSMVLSPFMRPEYTFTTVNAQGFKTSRSIAMAYEKLY